MGNHSSSQGPQLGALSHPFLVGRFGSPTKIDYRKKGYQLMLTSLLEDLVYVPLLVSNGIYHYWKYVCPQKKKLPHFQFEVLEQASMDIISRNPSFRETQKRRGSSDRFVKRKMVEKNGESM